MKKPNTLIMVFAKAPVTGTVKTRLIPALGQKRAAELYIQLVEHTLQTLMRLDGVTIQLHCAPDINADYFRQCENNYSLVLKKQKGDDLGARMRNAFQQGLEEYKRVICVGCDCPGITTEVYFEAITALQNGYDACISPAHDGGYALLGLTQYSPLLFENIEWGSPQVMKQTRDQMAAADFNCHELAVQHDIDIPADLIYCPEKWLEGIQYEVA